MEIRCQPLARAQLEAEVGFISEFVAARSPEGIAVAYGLACKVDPQRWWQDIPLAANGLAQFVAESRAIGVYRLGEADLVIRGAAGQFTFTLCHEGDVHFDGPPSLVREVEARWATAGYGPYQLGPAKPST